MNCFLLECGARKYPPYLNGKKWIHRNLNDNHCPECLMLDGCWFLNDKKPIWPHHPFCHCVLEDISYNDVFTKSSSDSAYSKFDPYLFDTKGEYGHGKDKLFKSWGYSVEDAKYLKAEIEKQALEKDYTIFNFWICQFRIFPTIRSACRKVIFILKKCYFHFFSFLHQICLFHYIIIGYSMQLLPLK